jgi:gliding motility-associated protein GldL
MSKLYGFGASVVIIGAMFKIMHWPGAGLMITMGLSTEAIIFFFSAFEPLHEEVDWTLVYPELAGITDDDEMENYKDSITSSRGNVVLEKFENLFEQSTLSPEILEKLGEGFAKLNSTANNLSDISEATVATQNYVSNFKNAAQKLDVMTNSYTENTEVLKDSIVSLSGTYQKAASAIEKTGAEISQQIEKSGSTMADSYQKLTNSISQYSNSVGQSGTIYSSQIEKMNKSLTELNTLYELQLKGTSEYVKNNEKLYSGLDGILKSLNDSVSETKRYHDEIAKLGDNLTALNNVYGNMLSAMNYSKK